MIIHNRNHAFTLIELIVVIGIIMILVALITTGLQAARAAASRTQCLANIRSLGQAALIYSQDDRGGKLPYSGTADPADGTCFGLLYDPVDFNDMSVYVCPVKERLGDPTKPDITADPPYSIAATLNSYRFVLNEIPDNSQSTAYPASNIILIENFTPTDPPSPRAFNHDASGLAAFFLNGKSKFIAKGNPVVPPNQDKSGNDYNFAADAAVLASYLKS